MVSCSGLTEKDNHNKHPSIFVPTENSGWAVCEELTLNWKNTTLVRRTGQGRAREQRSD